MYRFLQCTTEIGVFLEAEALMPKVTYADHERLVWDYVPDAFRHLDKMARTRSRRALKEMQTCH